MPTRIRSLSSQLTAVMCCLLLIPGSAPSAPPELTQPQAYAPQEEVPKIPNDQLDSLVAPIALYPDPLLAQVLAASTYPLEIIQLQQWLGGNQGLKDKALADAVQKEDWDPSIQALAALPDVVKRLADDIKWTTDLGNAFLAQQADVMDAVQRMRKKAYDAGNLKSSEQQKVETKVVETKTVVVIQQANPQVVYVPTYSPVVVYGPPVYPYPPIYYPPPSYYAAGVVVAFGVGVAMGAAWGGGWGYGCGWGRHTTIIVNSNNRYISHYNSVNINRTTVNNVNRTNVNVKNVSRNNVNQVGNNSWQHNAQHRGGTPYSNKATASQYGGTARGDSMATRQANARQNQAQTGGRPQAGTRPSQGQGQPGASNRSAGAVTGNTTASRARSGTGAANVGSNRSAASASNTGANRTGGAAGGGDRIGNRSVSPSPSAGSKGSAFGGASSGASGSSARASSSRGAYSMGAGGGGGRRK